MSLPKNDVMGKNITEKIISYHLHPKSYAGIDELALRIDHTLVHDATGQMAMLQFEALGQERIKNEHAVIYVDHNTVQCGPENMDDHLFLATAARKFGLLYSRAGNGICHQINLERFSIPGKTLLGADSHTTTAGAVGMLALGAGGLDVALAMAGQPFYMNRPQVLKVELRGNLPNWVAAKDLALEILRKLRVGGGRGKILEFSGPGLTHLTIPQRATIANMRIETGAFTAIFPSDDNTRAYFAAQGKEQQWLPLYADDQAKYDDELIIDLSQLEPLIARPHSPDNVVPVTELAGIPIDQVAIGSCTNSSFEDLSRVASILAGKTVAPFTSTVMTPGSLQTRQRIDISGALRHITDAGVRVLENVCGFCCGVDQSPRAGGISLRTTNRNFPGRSGTGNALLYLVSPETAAASAIFGCITDPRTLNLNPPKIEDIPFTPDDRLVLPPAPKTEGTKIHRGPNIARLPDFEELVDLLRGEVLLQGGDDITTDDILPGGAHILKMRGNIPAISEYIFSRMASGFSERAKQAGAGFIVAGHNYGQGSSREHAALAPRYLGVRAVIAISYARIHKANLINFGILPLEFIQPEDHRQLKMNHQLEIKDLHREVSTETQLTVTDLTSNASINVRLDISHRMRLTLLAGGRLNQIRKEMLPCK